MTYSLHPKCNYFTDLILNNLIQTFYFTSQNGTYLKDVAERWYPHYLLICLFKCVKNPKSGQGTFINTKWKNCRCWDSLKPKQ